MLAEHLLGFRQFLTGLTDMPSQGERRALDQIMQAMKEVRHTQTLQALFRKLNQSFRPVTHQVPYRGAERCQSCLYSCLPCRIGAVLGHGFQQHIPRAEVHQDQQHLFQERFIHRTNDLADLCPRTRLLLPSLRRLQQRGLHSVHDATQG